ncbi:hypothetical protein [Alienimonas sp. DA493]|uniref:hypothetical protein n=1 Tax=Alienimonas sp. DA493 TaxID=3373605 RepID=UPI0037547564
MTDLTTAAPTTAELAQRCADGVLTDAQRSDLLARLEAAPEGYRPLALALLERRLIDAALRDSLRTTGGEPIAPAVDPPAGRAWRRAAGWAFSAAAGLAVGLGWNAAAAPVVPPPPDGRSPIALADAATAPAPTPNATVAPLSVPPDPRAPDPGAPEVLPRPVARVEWRTESGRPFELPVYDERDVSPALAARAADPLPADLRAELIRTGRFGGEVRQEYTVPLPDGRLLTVPVHAVRVRQPEVF